MSQLHRILFFVCDTMLATSLTLPAEMLRAAETAAKARRVHTTSIDIVPVSITDKPVMTRAGITITPMTGLTTTTANDIIYLPALWRHPMQMLGKNSAAIDWLRQCHDNNTKIAGVGSGCFFIAATGLLDGKPATTHWYAFDLFEKHFPHVHLKRDFFITQAGNLYCAASINSLADLTVFFIREMFSSDIAHHVERHFSHEIRRPYESLRYFEGSMDKHSDEGVLQAQLWIHDHYSQTVKLPELAARCGMSVRTFNRRFKQSTGKSPLRYLQETRLGVARELIQTSNLSIGEISFRVGYQDLGHFSSLFKTMFGTTPLEYRTTVRAKLFTVS